MNKIILLGRLTRDPEIRGTDTKVAKYTLAVNSGYNRETELIECTAFGKDAEFAERYFHQGIKIILEGSLHIGNYTNKEGIKVKSAEVYVRHTEFAESKRVSDMNSTNGENDEKHVNSRELSDKVDKAEKENKGKETKSSTSNKNNNTNKTGSTRKKNKTSNENKDTVIDDLDDEELPFN